MRVKILYYCLTILFFISIVSAQNSLECSINPHYFNNGAEILVYNGNSSFDGILFQINAKNNINDSRILNISIINSEPSVFSTALFPSIPVDLRILQTKTLWISKIIDTKQFTNGEMVDFVVELSGTTENSEEVKASCSSEVLIKTEGENGFINNLGFLMPSHPTIGIIALFLLIFGFIYAVWRFDIPHKIRKINKKQEEHQYSYPE
jgi:hypothetical protein